jgi:hypothetical protein
MRSTIVSFGIALMIAVPAAPAAAAVGDFRLPPDPSTTQPPPDRQGPVAPDVPESRRPAPTPTPTASRPATVPTATQPPIVVPTLSTSTPRATEARRNVVPAATSAPVNPPPVAASSSAPAEPSVAGSPGFPVSRSSAAPVNATGPAPTERDAGDSGWLWVVGALLLAALGAAGWVWWRLRPTLGPLKVPEIERPRLVPAPMPEREPEPAPPPATAEPASAEPLQVTLEPLRLSLTLINATLAYRLEIANRGLAPLTGLTIGADMIAAHASMTREEHLAGPENVSAAQHIDRLEPGESRVVEGEFRVPFSQIVPIRQGNATLLLPLARFRVEAEGAEPVVRTFAVGQSGAGAALQPFRLDEGPRIYPKLTQRAFA